MNLKSLLLGSAAAMIVAGGAQAADLTVAEPVDYVKVCDAFGAGYFYSPGTDTCIKIGGYVRFDAWGGEDIGGAGRDHAFKTRARVEVTASSVTEFGPLTGFVRLQADSKNSDDGSVYTSSSNAYVDSAYLQLGPLSAGYFTSAFDYSQGLSLETSGFTSDQTTDHIALTYAFNGFGIIASVEDSRDRGVDIYADGMPDVIAAITYGQGPFDLKLSGAVVEHFEDQTGYAVQLGGTLKLDQLGAGDELVVVAGYSSDAGTFSGADKVDGLSLDGDVYNVLASLRHFWTPQVNSALTGSYVKNDTYDESAWLVSFSTTYEPVKNFLIGAEVNYLKTKNIAAVDEQDDAWTGLIRLQRNFP